MVLMTNQQARARLEQDPMAISQIVPTDVIIDLDDPPTGHRLAELLQALTGCSVENAELAISDPTPVGPASPDDALDVRGPGDGGAQGRSRHRLLVAPQPQP